MADILNRIADYKRQDVAARKALRGQDRVEADAKAADAPRGFHRALERGFKPGKLALIAEVKKASPSKGLIRADFNPAELARAYQTGGASALSILTDKPSFQGEDAYFVQAREAVTLPAIRKDFVVDPWQIAESRAFGADAILVIMALADDVLAAELMNEAARFGMDALVEVHDEKEMERAGALGARLVGVNNRDLRSFVTDLKVTARLAPLAPKDALLVTESGIFTPQDVRGLEAAGARAMLVGESLMRQKDVACATVALLS